MINTFILRFRLAMVKLQLSFPFSLHLVKSGFTGNCKERKKQLYTVFL